jgi:predicted nucleotidyltransferase
MARATPYAELNAVLDELVAGARSILGDNFCGAYLQGSFAVGDADEHSDVDFLVVTEREVDEQEQRELQALQERLFALPTHWAQHLEGSYVPRAQLRRLDRERRPWFYFDNGATEPAWDTHDNTAVVRWSLRERGVALAGPDPKELVDPISADDLRAEALRALDEWEAWIPTLERWSARLQPDSVLAYCRIFHTATTGELASKPRSARWALEVVADEWRGLIRQSLAERPDPWPKVKRPADPERVERTKAFMTYVGRVARANAGTPPAAR